MRRLWQGGQGSFAEFLIKELQEADAMLREGEGVELFRKQGEARVLAELVKHFSGASAARPLQNT